VRVGEEAIGFEPGDRVLAFAPRFSDAGAITSHLVTSAVLAAKIPCGLSFAEAASLPCAYVTSHFALVEAARMRPGERVLIHSATGGVGLSAIAVARRLGVDIVGSAGTPEKRDLLRELGIAKVLDSRAPGLAAMVAELTGGRGVDAVLNSLVGSAIPEGLASLAPYGRFLEIGKRDMWDNSAIGMGALLRNRSIFGIDLATMVEDQPERVGRLLRDVVEAVDQGAYPALPITVFTADRVAEAFQMMAAARHTGKIAIDTTTLWEGAASESTAKRATYLVTGGFGALGLVAAEVLADRGARRLALVGRREPSGAAADQIDALRRRGIDVRTSRIDISDPVEVRGLLDAIAADGEELRGIVHSAGVLDDGVAAELTPARFETVMRGKVEGARILDQLTADLPIELFIVFSSAAAVLGNTGQGNYAAANAMLDALAEDRRARGLPALSIAWGPWAEVGLAAKQSNRGERVAALGLQSLSLDEGRRLLAELIAGGTGDPWIAAMRFDAAQWVRTVAPGSATLLSPLLPAGDQDAAADAASIPGGIRDLEDVRGAVVHHLAALLRTAPESVAHDKPFQSLGLDSLMGLELRNRLERALDTKLSVSTIWNYSTVERLSRHLADVLAPPESKSRPSGIAPRVRAETPDEALERELAEAEALLVGSGRG
jgi:NADPH:quinone reductase-like Zn-dependent oxidoreductase/acyl carrier protein